MEVLAVVPARGGSTAIPKKNIRPLAGRPLIYYTIAEAKQSATINRLVVSTDDSEIATISKGFGAEVIRRPPEYATDEAPTELALIHVVETLRHTEGYEADLVVTLEPTSPLRTHHLIDRCVEELIRSGADSVLTVKENRACLGRLVEGRFEYLINGQPRRRQDREPLYQESGTVYVTKVETLLRTRSVVGGKLQAVRIEQDEAVDINSPADFVIAEAFLQLRRQGEHHD